MWLHWIWIEIKKKKNTHSCASTQVQHINTGFHGENHHLPFEKTNPDKSLFLNPPINWLLRTKTINMNEVLMSYTDENNDLGFF